MRHLVLLTLMILVVGCGEGLTFHAWKKNREAITAIKNETPDLAAVALTDALAESPFQPELHLNLGVASQNAKKPDDAEKSFKAANEISKTPIHQFISRYNLGVINGNEKKVDEALVWYQAALSLNPASKEIKTNIELLIEAQGKGQGEGEEQSQDGEGSQSKDKKNKDQKGQGDQDQEQDGKGDQEKEEKPKEYGAPPPQYKPREFKGELHEADVKKILGEIKQQEQRIRSEFNRRDVKERPKEKDW